MLQFFFFIYIYIRVPGVFLQLLKVRGQDLALDKPTRTTASASTVCEGPVARDTHGVSTQAPPGGEKLTHHALTWLTNRRLAVTINDQ